MGMSDRTFGVEIECFGAGDDGRNRHDGLRRILLDSNIRVVSHWRNEHDSNYRGWTLKSDCSIEAGHGCALEIVSPILSGIAGLREVRKVCKILEANGYEVNRSCGLHVHVNAQGLTASEVYQVVQRYAAGENLIDSFIENYRRNSSWCRPATPQLQEIRNQYHTWRNHNFGTGLEPICTVENPCRRGLGYGQTFNNGQPQGEDYQYCGLNVNPCGGRHENRGPGQNPFHSVSTMCTLAGYAAGRSSRVNCEAYQGHGTIEFRHHHATTDAKEITNWIRFLVNFVEVSRELAPQRDGEGRVMEPALRKRDTGPMLGLPSHVRKHMREQIVRYESRSERRDRLRATEEAA